jgi:hypothetical protein
VTPAAILAKLDAEAADHERKALHIRSVADRLRADLAEAVALVAPQSPVEPPPVNAKPNGASAPSPRSTRPRRDPKRAYVLRRLRREGRGDLADQIERGERSLYGAERELGWRKPEPSRSSRRKPRQRPITNGDDQVTRRRPLRHPSPLDGDPRLDKFGLDRVNKIRRLARVDLGLAEDVLAGKRSLNAAMIETGMVKPPPPSPATTPSFPPTVSGVPTSEQPVDEQIREEVNAAMQQEARAAAALDAHRALRRAQEPPPRWTSAPVCHLD